MKDTREKPQDKDLEKRHQEMLSAIRHAGDLTDEAKVAKRSNQLHRLKAIHEDLEKRRERLK